MKKTIYSLLLLCSIMSSVNAQQKENNNKQESVNAKVADFSINKASTDVEIKRITEILEKQYGIQLKTSKIKRNSNNEITAIKIDYKYKDGNEVSIVKKGDEPIDEIFINEEKGTIVFHTETTNQKGATVTSTSISF
ncbi:hypothetical protein [Flavobacterium sp.]|uniref:hypothetical protein n=1 Tax=Flavobacterium sp. TaxID=239 RepID=UPI0037BFC04C